MAGGRSASSGVAVGGAGGDTTAAGGSRGGGGGRGRGRASTLPSWMTRNYDAVVVGGGGNAGGSHARDGGVDVDVVPSPPRGGHATTSSSGAGEGHAAAGVGGRDVGRWHDDRHRIDDDDRRRRHGGGANARRGDRDADDRRARYRDIDDDDDDDCDRRRHRDRATDIGHDDRQKPNRRGDAPRDDRRYRHRSDVYLSHRADVSTTRDDDRGGLGYRKINNDDDDESRTKRGDGGGGGGSNVLVRGGRDGEVGDVRDVGWDGGIRGGGGGGDGGEDDNIMGRGVGRGRGRGSHNGVPSRMNDRVGGPAVLVGRAIAGGCDANDYENGSNVVVGRGSGIGDGGTGQVRGRGRGRAKSALSSVGGGGGGTMEMVAEEGKDMVNLLARARMAQRGGMAGEGSSSNGASSGQQRRGGEKHIESNDGRGDVVQVVSRGGASGGRMRTEDDDDEEERRMLQERMRMVREEEDKERDRRIEEEERRRLLALVGEDVNEEDEHDNGDVGDGDGGGGDGGSRGGDESGKKRGNSSNTPFEFETEEEREERYARDRREERRRKRQRAVESAGESAVEDKVPEENGEKREQVKEEEGKDGVRHSSAIDEGGNGMEKVVVDRPRNELGVIMSELNDVRVVRRHDDDGTMMMLPSNEANLNADDGAYATIGITEANDSDSGSFDMFAADDVTPAPTTTTTAKYGGGRRDGGNRPSSGAVTNNAQECDDAEGYYKATIGEIIALPRERWDRSDTSAYGGGVGDGGHMARFRVLGIIGKGVFSSVIKCVEEGTDVSGSGTASASNGDGGIGGGRIVAIKIIRNNEVMAKAAAKEMRILRILCQQSTKSSVMASQSKKEGCAVGGHRHDINPEANEEDEDEEDDVKERQRRERENHNIVRLVDVDSKRSSSAVTDAYLSSPAYAAPPPEFRSHCVFLFEFLPYNLREVLSKFGKNVGINLTAVRSYARQLLCALAHLERHRVVHGA